MQYVGRNCETPAPVMTEPTSVLIPEIVYVPIFSQAVFVCQVTGSPQPSIDWFKDDVIIPNEESQFLIVPSVTLSDRGKYYCTATNTLGTDISNTGYLGIYGQYRFSIGSWICHIWEDCSNNVLPYMMNRHSD